MKSDCKNIILHKMEQKQKNHTITALYEII